MQMKNRNERGESGKIYYVKSVIERMNSPTLHGQNVLVHCERFMADRMAVLCYITWQYCGFHSSLNSVNAA